MNFRTVFDAAHAGYSNWSFLAFGLIFACFGTLLVFRPAFMLKLMPSGFQGKARTVFSWFFLTFAVLWTVVTFESTYRDLRTVTTALQTGRYSVVQGPVTHFVPAPYTGNFKETFVVGNRRFSYSDYLVTAGFHNTASHGGPVRAGLYVRVTYLGNLILRLEVAQ
jgi:hypothetical protein